MRQRMKDEQDKASASSFSLPPSSFRYYQLTHDYLVHSLRDWLTRKQKETRRGRAEIRFEEAAALWESKRDRHFLPSLWEWLCFGVLIRRRNWTESQRKMMRLAARRHSLRIVAAVVILSGLSWWGSATLEQMKAESLVSKIQSAAITEVPKLVTEMAELHGRAEPILKKALAESAKGSRERVHFSLALASVDPRQVPYLLEQSLQADPITLTVIRESLGQYSDRIDNQLWDCLESEDRDRGERFRAAQMLAWRGPATSRDEARWSNVVAFVAERLETLSRPARKLFELIVREAYHGPLRPKVPGTATPPEILEACGLGVEEFYVLLDALKDAGLIRVSNSYPFEEIQLTPRAQESLGDPS